MAYAAKEGEAAVAQHASPAAIAANTHGGQLSPGPRGIHHTMHQRAPKLQALCCCCWYPSAAAHTMRPSGNPTREDGSQYHVYNVRATVLHLSQHAFERSLLDAKAHIHDNLPKSLNKALGDDPLNPKNPHRPLRHIGSAFWHCCPGSSLRTIIRLRSSNCFAGWPAYYAGATNTPYCTICEDTTKEGGWEHTLSSCLHPVHLIQFIHSFIN